MYYTTFPYNGFEGMFCAMREKLLPRRKLYEHGANCWRRGAQLTFSNMGAMDYVLAVVALLGGLGAFLFGFKVLSR